MRKHFLKSCSLALLGVCMGVGSLAQPIEIKVNRQTGAVEKLQIKGDKDGMDWLVATDGSQYPWVKENYGWGLGYFTETAGGESRKQTWNRPESISADGLNVTYKAGNIGIRVSRRWEKDDLTEEYVFRNEGSGIVSLSDIGIYTPLNDNYPDALTCVHARTNVHLWEGDDAAYINALRMGGYAPHLGVAVRQGAIKSYEIAERGINKYNSQTRGIISLNMPDMQLKPGQESTLRWTLFTHTGNDDFRRKLLEMGGVLAECDKYVYELGEKARITLRGKLKKCTLTQNGTKVPIRRKGDVWVAEVPMTQAGEVRFDFYYDNGKRTHADCLVIENADKLMQTRVDFIRTRQQMNNPADPRDGAYMVYDNEGDSIYLNDTPNCNPADRDEGAERIGMGLLLAKQYLRTKAPELKTSLVRYAKFLREKLQTSDYVTYSSVDHKGRNRGYNYTWAACLYFQMYRVTGDKRYAMDGYQTLQALYRQFGYGFYSIEIPVRLGLQVLKDAGMTREYDDLRQDFIRTGDAFVRNGLNYPKHEVNYEQSIVAPAIYFLAQLYLETGDRRYLDEVKRQMPVLESFNGFQPSYHLNEVAIRHWDGYWFGKCEMFGDTFPHYWSTATGAAYYYYSLCTGDETYRERARNVVRNNLCLFFADGKASCAYMYPYKVNGVRAQFYDAYANDQDWALVYYLLVNFDIL